MSGWGTTPWGLGPWGGVVPLTITKALAVSERTVRVTLSAPALAVSAIGPGDALNPSSWNVDEMAGLDVVRSLNVLQARPLRTNAEFELYTLQKFNTYLHIHRVSASILSAGYVPILYPNHALFPGLVADISAQARAATLQDIRNPQFAGTDGTGGVFRLQPGGDYQTESGQQLITKLVVRRLTTDPDAFFHLVPGTYGLGLALKERYPLGDLTAFKAAIERQVLREPEIVECAAQVSLTAGGVLTIILRARLAAGTQVTIPLPPIPSAFTAT